MSNLNTETWKSKEMIRLILSIVLLVIGLILLAVPKFAMDVIVIIIGVVVLAYGVVQLLMNLSKRKQGDAAVGFAVPVICIIIGLLLIIFHAQVAMVLLPLIIGLWAIVTGVMSLMESAQVKEQSVGAARMALIAGIAELVLGIIIVIGIFTQSSTLGMLLGVCLTIYGVMSLIEWGMVASAKKQ
ncbi:MAG: DUF308 domain-containing protein [Christensenella sp.]